MDNVSVSSIPMNKFFSIVFLLMMMLDGVFAQAPHSKDARDYRATLDIRGRISEISVSPDEHIWLSTATGNLYYANGIDADWHSIETDTRKNKEDDDLWLNNPNFDRVSFFNADTAILTGYIAFDPTSYHYKSGYYRTTDGGRTWKLLNLGKDGWMYAVEVDQYGHAWLGTNVAHHSPPTIPSRSPDWYRKERNCSGVQRARIYILPKKGIIGIVRRNWISR